MDAIVRITGKKFQKVQELKKSGLMEWQAVCKVLKISEDTNFVVNVISTSSNPDTDGLIVTFIN